MKASSQSPQMEKLVLSFTKERDTKRTSLFQEQLGEQTYSDKDIAVGPIYIQKEALELIGNPEKIKITIEPIS